MNQNENLELLELFKSMRVTDIRDGMDCVHFIWLHIETVF